jgi:spermidine synthase
MDMTVDRRIEDGQSWELRRRGEAYDLFVEGKVVARSDVLRNAHALAELTLAPWSGHDDVHVLLAGLGVGHVLRELLARPEVQRVDVAEISRAVIDWQTQFLGAATSDPRVKCEHVELGALLRQPREGTGWMAIVVDVDEWPIALSRPENVELYHDEGIRLLVEALRPGGVLVLWSARRDDELHARMGARLTNVARITADVDGTETGLDYVYRGRRAAISKPAD